MRFGWKNCLYTVFVLLLCLLFGGGMYAMNCISLKKTAGERIFYLNSSSSQGLMKNKLCFRDLPRVRGESVCFMHQINAHDLALQIFKDYDAEVLFVERVGDVISYYGYAQGLGEVLCLDGYIINLHVAVTNERCVVGTPIIFGGF